MAFGPQPRPRLSAAARARAPRRRSGRTPSAGEASVNVDDRKLVNLSRPADTYISFRSRAQPRGNATFVVALGGQRGPANRDDDRVGLGLPGVVDARSPHGVVARAFEPAAIGRGVVVGVADVPAVRHLYPQDDPGQVHPILGSRSERLRARRALPPGARSTRGSRSTGRCAATRTRTAPSSAVSRRPPRTAPRPR